MEAILYKKSGLLGISGISNDMRDLLGAASPAARLAVDYFVYRAAKEIGALAAVLGGIDGLVFTAGIGENSAEIRRRIGEASGWLGIEMDAEANDDERSADLQGRQPGLGVGDPDQRGADDRPAHGRLWASGPRAEREALSFLRAAVRGNVTYPAVTTAGRSSARSSPSAP